MGSLFGSKKQKAPPPVERPTIKNYDPATHTSQVTPLKRNPNILGGPGAEAALARWDIASKRYDVLETARKKQVGRGPKNGGPISKKDRNEHKALQKELQTLEPQIMSNIWRAPAGYGQQQTPAAQAPAAQAPAAPAAQAPAAPTAGPAPAAPAPAAPTAPGSTEAPVATAAGNILGMTGTLNAGGAAGRSPRRRGRMQTLLSGYGGTSETLGG